jgi:TonB-dependent receptor
MYTTNFGKLGVLSGVRVEHTEATYGAYVSPDVNGSAPAVFEQTAHSYTNFFPTVQFKYAANDSLQVRLTYSTGIARPGFSQAGGFAGVDFTQAPNPVFTKGNPQLKATTGNNFDLDVEYYLPGGGLIQVGLFDKEFQNYIFKHTVKNVIDPIFQGVPGDYATFANESAYARGLEAAYHQKFSQLPGLLSGLGLEANFTLVKSSFLEYDSTVSVDHKNHYGSLPGTSNLTWNVSGFYESHGLELRLATEYVGHSLFGLNGDQSLDTIQDNKLNLDFTSSYKVNSHWTGYFNVKNLLNTPLRYYEGSTNRPIQREVYGQTYEFGVRARF